MEATQQTFTFQAEIKQVLDILIHSLYTEQEIFLRELVSNASDALNRVQFEMLTNQNVVDPDAELAIEIKADDEAGTLTISDSGIGMTQDELVNNLGTIARSGAKAFIEAIKDAKDSSAAQNVIGQFGVGFYSVFMVADKVRVVTRSADPSAQAVAWESQGDDTYIIEPSERAERGTDIIITLKDDAKEFLQTWKLKEIVRRHSDYVAFPIYVGEDEDPTNKQTAIWRQEKSDITDEQYDDFYKMMTLDFEQPLKRIHMRADVPLQFYALLYIPGNNQPNMFSPRKEPGLKLYARKILIQEYSKELLPEYLNFVQGVVDSEDLPLNVSRESVQANRIMVNLKKTLTNKVLSELKRMASKRPDEYVEIFNVWGRYLKQGVALSPEDREDLEQLLFFPSTTTDNEDDLISFQTYVDRMAENQEDIYYVVGDDFHSTKRSPHLDAFRQRGIEVLYFTDPIDAIMLNGLSSYKDHQLKPVDSADIDLSNIGEVKEDETPQREAVKESDFSAVVSRFEDFLGERVRDVRESKTLVGSPARLISDEDDTSRQMYRINRLLDRDYELPVKILELNPRHPLLHNLSNMVNNDSNNPLVPIIIEQVFETALLQDGIHPDPASMADRLTALMQAATGSSVADLNYTPTPGPAKVKEEADDSADIEEVDEAPSFKGVKVEEVSQPATEEDEEEPRSPGVMIEDADYTPVDKSEDESKDSE